VNRSIQGMLIVTLFTVGAWAAGAWQASISTRSSFLKPAPITFEPPAAVTGGDSGWSALPIPLLDDPQPDAREDLFGNDVSDAVATYKRDGSGSLYEEHSPHTEVPRLKSPTT
jgi:hypothetical protein